jgi:dynein regulatory complex subunit 2
VQMKKLMRLQESLNQWKAKIGANSKECEERNKLLRAEKEQILRHFHELKAKMNRAREREAARLQTLCLRSSKCLKELATAQGRAENILKLAELNRKLETEREKVIPFYPTPTEETGAVPEVRDGGVGRGGEGGGGLVCRAF